MRTLYAGAGVALAAGLLLGGAMKPQLALDDRPAGPQIFTTWSGERSTGPFDDGGGLAFAGYSGQIPDYVLGTDWRKALTPVAMAQPDPAYPDTTEDKDGAPAYADDLTASEAADLPAEPVDERPAPFAERAPYAASAEAAGRDASVDVETAPPGVDAEAPPEATGDTRLAVEPPLRPLP